MHVVVRGRTDDSSADCRLVDPFGCGSIRWLSDLGVGYISINRRMLKKLRSMSDWLAIKMLALVATMECVYLFTAWSVLPLFWPGTQAIVFYVSGGILQLVLLPAILVGQNLISRVTEQRAIQDHEALMEAVADLRRILQDDDHNLVTLNSIDERLSKIEANLSHTHG